MVNLEPATRIFGVQARSASRVVLFRRGPSKQVLVLTWDTLRHEFRSGQWLKGRIYEERCDLSPSGDKLVYLAGNHRAPFYAWTAVSRPPFLTALALWPNTGTWGGGGLFESERTLLINRLGGPGKLADGFRLPSNVRVLSIGEWAGRGEDEPIRGMRMRRDGWELVDQGVTTKYQFDAPMKWTYIRPQRWRKACGSLVLERRILGVGERDGAWYVTEHRVLDADENVVLDLGRSEWADWSHSQELIHTKQGSVCRVARTRQGGLGNAEELIDLGKIRFEQVPPTPGALRWDGNRIFGRKLK